MSMNYQKVNNVTGWLIFAIATIVYTLTVEDTASFWDCGEFIAVSYKLEVPHPPGAPLVLLIGRMFSFLALGDVTQVAYWINMVSVLSSGFTILFMFWTMTVWGRKLWKIEKGNETNENIWRQFLQLAKDCGFADPRLLEHEPGDITDSAVQSLLGDICFRSATCRLFRAEGLEPGQENYGQTATYLGTIPEYPDSLCLDTEQSFTSRQSTPVSGNTAQILGLTRFSDHFDLNGDRSQHLGSFSDSNRPDIFAAVAPRSTRSSCC